MEKNENEKKNTDTGKRMIGGKKVLWTGESNFEVFGSQRRIFVRHRTNVKMLEECLTSSVSHGGRNW